MRRAVFLSKPASQVTIYSKRYINMMTKTLPGQPIQKRFRAQPLFLAKCQSSNSKTIGHSKCFFAARPNNDSKAYPLYSHTRRGIPISSKSDRAIQPAIKMEATFEKAPPKKTGRQNSRTPIPPSSRATARTRPSRLKSAVLSRIMSESTLLN